MNFKYKAKLNPLCLLILLIWFLSHIPFFSADADLNASPGSRGAWTDEGLYSGQIRNFINHNHFDIMEGDALLKTPLFSACLYVPFKLFGTLLLTARSMVLILLGLLLFIFHLFKRFRSVYLLLIPTTLMLFSIHQYSHFALAEMISISLILIAAVTFVGYRGTGKIFFLILTFVFLSFSVLMKLQFIYVLIIPSLAMILESYLDKKTILNRSVFISIACVFVICLLFYLAWYLPFKNEFRYMARLQSGNFTFEKISFNSLARNVYGNFFNRGIIYFTLCFIVAFGLALKWIIKKTILNERRTLLLFALIWSIVELHKLPMEYLPVRYLVSLYFSMGLIISVVFAHLLSTERRFIFRVGSLTVIGVLVIINLVDYYHAYKRRTYVISELNQYFAGYDLKDKIIIGPWAPSLTWGSGSISFPVWSNFLQKSVPFKTYKPFIVISEPYEEDSQKAYLNQGIDLTALSDSIKEVKIAYWKVNIYWIKQKRL